MEKPVIIIGTGGHAKVILDLLKLINKNIIGVVDSNKKQGAKWQGENVLGDDSSVFEYDKDSVYLVNGIGYMPNANIRHKLDADFRKYGYEFLTIVHPKAIVSESIELGEGVQIMAGAIIQLGAKLGNSIIINTGVIIDHDCVIEDNVHVSTGTTVCGSVKIGKNTFIGANSTIMQNIKIGNNCIVGAGTVVYKNIDDDKKILQKKDDFICSALIEKC